MPRFPFVVVVGAGPAGLMAAGRASEVGASVALLERNHRLALKLRISGKGRCNLTNTASTERFIEAFAPNGQFLYGPLSRFSPEDLRALLACLGVPTVEERGGRVFPASGRASDVADALEQWARRNGARVLRGCSARALVIRECAVAGVKTDDGNTLEADAVVVATGGLSYPRTGSTGDGYRLARQAGHTIVPCRPALVPLETVEDWPKSLQGVSLRNVAATLLVDGHRQASEFGEMLFTHFGMSGPIILTLSRTVVPLLEKGKVEVSIDLKPALSPE
ncbi:MAG: NAD(P)/FAD-dependent oxidoreductase, partial [Armatimonadota bacterium]